MRVLVACEFSGRVRDAFRKRGHDAWSCDLLPSEQEGPHLQCDVLSVLDRGWDLMVAHPPCTHIALSGGQYFLRKGNALIASALQFFADLLNAPIPRICVENPVSLASSYIAKHSQVIQPYWFGDMEQKTTCLWFKNLPHLVKTCEVEPVMVEYNSKERGTRRYPAWHSRPTAMVKQSVWREAPGHRWKNRSRTFPGVAEAMAEQWGSLSRLVPQHMRRPTSHVVRPVEMYAGAKEDTKDLLEHVG